MSTLLLTENFPPVIGGSARWLWELYRRLPRADIVIAAGARAGADALDRRGDLRVQRLPLSFPDLGLLSAASWTRYRRAQRQVAALIRREGVDRIHCGRLLPEGWVAWRLGLPYGCFVYGEELATARTSRQLTWMARRVQRGAALLIADSRYAADLLRTDWGVPASKIAVLHPGVDCARFVPAARQARARAALGWGDRLVVLTVARLQRRKGHDRLIEAVALLRARFPTLLYAIIGSGAEEEALRALVARHDLAEHVRFHGALDDAQVISAYQQCDLFALPNRTDAGDVEGFGMVLLEAQACGRAVLAGDSGGTAETLRRGETGVLVDCTRAEVLADALSELLADGARRERMGAAARRWAEGLDFDARAAAAAAVLAGVPGR